MMDKTIEYYNKNANIFSLGTEKLDFSKMPNHFLKFLSKGDYILDFGCGSGRDAKYFLAHGMNVDLVDGSWKMCEEISCDMEKCDAPNVYVLKVVPAELRFKLRNYVLGCSA